MSPLTASKTVNETPILSDSSTDFQPPLQRFSLRPLTLADVPTLACHSAEAYWEGPVNRFIAPYAAKYRSDFVRNFHQAIRRRLFNPRSLSLVACENSDQAYPVGYAQFTRQGDDEGARAYIGQHSVWTRVYFFVFAWFFWIHDKVENFVWPDRSCDVEATKQFLASANGDENTYWKSHAERSNRWHVQSVVISPAYQGKGLGRMLVTEAVKRAQRERIIMGLSASPAGEFLYRKLGFKLLGEFTMRIGGEEGGGIMIRYPEGED
ncbi:acyl-CoA N-acyltransferase [Cadophora sp. DSE1049]|nr:acyl-CoA N-acyltransferase [Cadophora sp. DSE1049]